MSLVISLLFFHLADLSLNIISLSGLILGIGMMIDNSIIVIDNITQYIDRGESLAGSCIKGAEEVIRPLISSVLTTCAVFIPLIFISGISGSLFHDQAIAVAMGLIASLIVSITLIPVLYYAISVRAERKGRLRTGKFTRILQKLDIFKAEDLYERGFDHIFRRRKITMFLFLALLIPACLMIWLMPKERFPQFTHNELLVKIDWNQNINIDENIRRTEILQKGTAASYSMTNAYAGTQKFILHKDMDQDVSETLIWFACDDASELPDLRSKIKNEIAGRWPDAVFAFQAPKTIFEKLFEADAPMLVARVSNNQSGGIPTLKQTRNMTNQLQTQFQGLDLKIPPSDSYIEVSTRPDMLALYKVNHDALFNTLKAALNSYQVGVLHTGSQYVPMVIGQTPMPVGEIIKQLKITNSEGTEIPVSSLISTRTNYDYKVLYGSRGGPYVPLNMEKIPTAGPREFMNEVTEILTKTFDADVTLTGNWFESQKLVQELLVVLMISLLLLYFILAAQFESLRQPIILLLEVPIDIAGALFLLWLFGGTINLMAMIGIVVMSGIIVNDSILKIDTINRLRRDGKPLVEAIREGGHRRLKPIIMTSITTILALVPVLWSGGMGSELQRPLALTVIGGMILGTAVSLYFIPLCYYYLMRGKEKEY